MDTATQLAAAAVAALLVAAPGSPASAQAALEHAGVSVPTDEQTFTTGTFEDAVPDEPSTVLEVTDASPWPYIVGAAALAAFGGWVITRRNGR